MWINNSYDQIMILASLNNLIEMMPLTPPFLRVKLIFYVPNCGAYRPTQYGTTVIGQLSLQMLSVFLIVLVWAWKGESENQQSMKNY